MTCVATSHYLQVVQEVLHLAPLIIPYVTACLQVSRLQQQALQVHPDIAANSSRATRLADTSFPPDVENEANAYYQQVWPSAPTS